MTLAPLDSLGLVASLVVLDLCVGRPLLSRQVEEHDAHNDLEEYNVAFLGCLCKHPRQMIGLLKEFVCMRQGVGSHVCSA